MPTERVFQSRLIKRLESMFPGCSILRPDPSRNQGIPDLLILYRDRWAMLELKKASNSKFQANQEYHVDRYNGMSFAAVIDPSNEEEVLVALQSSFGARRSARIS